MTFKIPVGEIASPESFNLLVDTYSLRGGKQGFDTAPGWGNEVNHWYYQVTTSPPPPPPPPEPDTTAPETSFTATPDAETASAAAEFVFSSSEEGSTFECSLGGAAFEACTSPVTLTGLAPGSHTFQARATDMAGNTDASPASYAWIVIEPEPWDPVLDRRSSFIYDQPSYAYTTGPSSRVLVHYVTTGPDAPSLDDRDFDGVPDYVEEIAEDADFSLAGFSRLGFRAPLRDTDGSDDRLDIYVRDLGYTTDPEGVAALAVTGRGRERGTDTIGDHVVFDPRVSDPYYRSSTVAHELFHLIQSSYGPVYSLGDLPGCWLTEGTATAAAVWIFPYNTSNQWRSNYRIGAWMERSWVPLNNDPGDDYGSCYTGSPWWQFLHQADPGLIPAYFELASRNDNLLLLKTTVENRLGWALRDAFSLFAADMVTKAEELRLRGTLRPAGTAESLSDTVGSLAAHYHEIKQPPADGGCTVSVTVDGEAVGARLLADGVEVEPVVETTGQVSFLVDVCRYDDDGNPFRSSDDTDQIILVVAGGDQPAASYHVLHQVVKN